MTMPLGSCLGSKRFSCPIYWLCFPPKKGLATGPCSFVFGSFDCSSISSQLLLSWVVFVFSGLLAIMTESDHNANKPMCMTHGGWTARCVVSKSHKVSSVMTRLRSISLIRKMCARFFQNRNIFTNFWRTFTKVVRVFLGVKCYVRI